MNRIDRYLEAAERANTRRSYQGALRHFEVAWGGLLPASSESIARYLADHAHTLSHHTLRHRLAALSHWHRSQGFPDPTKSNLVRQVLKGIRREHPAQEKQAKPIQIDVLNTLDQYLSESIGEANAIGDRQTLLRHTRNRAIVLLGFWRGFRSDELINLRLENLTLDPSRGLTCFIPSSKGDREAVGRTFRCPALSRLCPVSALGDWIKLSALSKGPVFRSINRWGHISEKELSSTSIIPLIRELLEATGTDDVETFSSHSLRRGFASWADANGWDIRELMEYVGWKDMRSALHYVDISGQNLQDRFERGLTSLPPVIADNIPAPQKQTSVIPFRRK
ncbi:site-specific integrase [Burkholderiaceae bacterium DAT-1]|nr:site-specific integrase [Burkholderiaceae bacterium DAT-1]